MNKPTSRKTQARVSRKSRSTNDGLVAKEVVKALEDLKGNDIVQLDVRELTDVTEIMIIVSGTSSRHVKSLADNAMTELKKAGYPPIGIEGQDAGEWILVDFGSVVLHVMQPAIREFYDLERLWSGHQESASREDNE